MMLALPSERELALDARPIPPAMIFCCSAASSAGGLVAMSSVQTVDNASDKKGWNASSSFDISNEKHSTTSACA